MSDILYSIHYVFKKIKSYTSGLYDMCHIPDFNMCHLFNSVNLFLIKIVLFCLFYFIFFTIFIKKKPVELID